jgi:uncharacterized membrane protein
MAESERSLKTKDRLFGNLAVVSFLIVQCLDGVFTYLGISFWGNGIEANPLVRSAVELAGLGVGLTGVKLAAAALGIALHLRQVHLPVALLTATYVVAAILPWSYLFLSSR